MLIEFKTEGEQTCICKNVMILKYERQYAHVQRLNEQLRRQETGSAKWERTLGTVRAQGNKLRALKEIMREITETERVVGSMVKVAINGIEVYRINPNDDRRRSCHRKNPHDTMKEAETAADEMTHRLGEYIEAYKCRHCDFFHTGHAFEPKVFIQT